MPDFAAPAAGAAPHRLCAGLGAGPLTFGTGLETLDAYRLGGAGGDFGEGELQSDLDVVPAAPIAPGAPTKQIFKTSAAAYTEVPHENHKSFGEVEVHRAETGTRPLAAAAHAGHAVAVVGGALVGIAQYLVRFA